MVARLLTVCLLIGFSWGLVLRPAPTPKTAAETIVFQQVCVKGWVGPVNVHLDLGMTRALHSSK